MICLLGGNQEPPPGDYPDVQCDDAREAISAGLDGEDSAVDAARVEEHLARCPGCRSWRETAHAHTRLVRLRAAEPPWHPTQVLLSAVPLVAGSRRRRLSILLLRAGLLSLAAAQVAFVVPAWLFGSHDAARDVGAFDLAMATGFLLAAWRPDRSRGMTVIVGTAALLLLATAVVETASGRTGAFSEAPHLAAAVGWVLLYRLSVLIGPGPGDGTPSWAGGNRFSFAAPGPGRRRRGGVARHRGSAMGASDVTGAGTAEVHPAPQRRRRSGRRAAA